MVMAVAMAGASFSITALVASGVQSRGAKPVPPIVRIKRKPRLSAQSFNVFCVLNIHYCCFACNENLPTTDVGQTEKSQTLISEVTYCMHRSVTRLDGAWGKEEVGRPIFNIKSFRSKCSVLTKILVAFWDFSSPPAVSWHPYSDWTPGELCSPFSPFLHPCLGLKKSLTDF